MSTSFGIEVKGLDQLLALPKKLQAEAPFIAARSLTRLASESKRAIEGEMRGRFDRPKPWTLRAIAMESATKQSLQSRVGLRADKTAGGDSWSDVLAPQFEGGQRGRKKFERRLNARRFVVPGPAAPLDQYGNVSRSDIRQILRYVGALDARSMSDRSRKRFANKFGRQFFATKRGIFERANGEGNAVLLFARPPRYKSRIDLHRVTQGVVDRRWAAIFLDSMGGAIR